MPRFIDSVAGPWKEKPSATSPQTDAQVSVTLIGDLDESGPHVLGAELARGRAGLANDTPFFQAGAVDEFAVTCNDIGNACPLS